MIEIVLIIRKIHWSHIDVDVLWSIKECPLLNVGKKKPLTQHLLYIGMIINIMPNSVKRYTQL